MDSRYTVGSEMIHFNDGTSGERWYVAEVATGRQVISGVRSETEARDMATIRELSESVIVVPLVNGDTVEVAMHSLDRFRGLDRYGNKVYEDHGIVYATTPCCDATGTGSGGGVCCRNCYEYVDSYFGGEATVAIAAA